MEEETDEFSTFDHKVQMEQNMRDAIYDGKLSMEAMEYGKVVFIFKLIIVYRFTCLVSKQYLPKFLQRKTINLTS